MKSLPTRPLRLTPGKLTPGVLRRAARRLRALSRAMESANPLASFAPAPAIEALEERRLLASNIIVEVPTASDPNSVSLNTYTPTGTAVGFPVPIFPQQGTDGPPRDRLPGPHDLFPLRAVHQPHVHDQHQRQSADHLEHRKRAVRGGPGRLRPIHHRPR
jgi:hypothetical protein